MDRCEQPRDGRLGQEIRVGPKKGPSLKQVLGTSAEREMRPRDLQKGLIPGSSTKGMGTFTPDRAGPPWTPQMGPWMSRAWARDFLGEHAGFWFPTVMGSCVRERPKEAEGTLVGFTGGNSLSCTQTLGRGSGKAASRLPQDSPAGCEASTASASSLPAAPTSTPEEGQRASPGAQHPGSQRPSPGTVPL